MNENKNKTKKKNSSAAAKLIKVLVPSILIGAVLGFLIGYYQEMVADVDMTAFWDSFNTASYYAMPAVYAVVFIAIIALCLHFISKAKKIIANWDGEDEDTIDKAEKSLSISLSIGSIGNLVTYFMFGLWAYFMSNAAIEWDAKTLVISLAFLLLFLVSLIVSVLIQRTAVELTKKVNPEKKGDLLDFKFAKEWENSCDEAEKLTIYKSGYLAYKVTNYVCIGLWLICVLGEMSFGFGITPLLFVTAIWLSLTLTYLITAYKLENKR